jgi:hypothetical protein
VFFHAIERRSKLPPFFLDAYKNQRFNLWGGTFRAFTDTDTYTSYPPAAR